MKVLVSALEASSNFHLKTLLRHLNQDQIELLGIFDRSLGCPIYGPEDFSVMGFIDVVKKLSFLMQAQKQMVKLSQEADKVLLLDSSSFHLPLAKKIKKLYPEKEIIYYILPQVWAWKPWRAKELEKNCDRLAAILPFEVNYYQSKAEYVGHPLLDSIMQCKESIKGDGIVFMPGSRRGEIQRILTDFYLLAEKYFQQKRKILVVPKMWENKDLKEIYGEKINLFEIYFDAREALLEAEFAFICSGTATLEAALIGTPFVLAYRARNFDYYIYKSLIGLSCIGLANIFYQAICGQVAGRGNVFLHPELIQSECSAENLYRAYKNMDKEQFFIDSKKIHSYLGHGSAKNIAKWIL